MNMQAWLHDMISAPVKKAMPILSFPSIQLMGIGVRELIADGAKQADGMRRVAERTDAAAAVSMMDLSVEAEAFGAAVRFSDDEVPTVTGRLVTSLAEAQALAVPSVTAGRTGLYVDAIRQAVSLIPDRPVFAGVIGPFSLAGRLMDVSEAMINCYEEPEMVHETLRKVTAFIIAYIRAYKEAGAHGVIVAEPLAGLLSLDLVEEFSTPYMRQIVEQTQDDDFLVLYHNCGNNTVRLIESILSIGAAGYHFGDAIDMEEMLTKIPEGTLVMGNISPAGQFRGGTPDSMREATLALLETGSRYPHFVISSGCDIPPLSSWENIDAFFAAVAEFYAGQSATA